MSAPHLLMLTSYYPYGHGETFIVAELEHIAPGFADVELVPSFYTPGEQPRPEPNPVNLGYADTRRGLLRLPRMLLSLLQALVHYRWTADLVHLLRHGRRLDNLKELVRALYRARIFERFLAKRAVQGRGKGGAQGSEIMYFYWLVPEIAGALRHRERTGADIRIVCRAHRGDLYEALKPGGYAGLRRGIAAGIDDIYCISEHGTRYLAECFPQWRARFHTARLGVNDPVILNPQPAGGPLRIVSCAFVIASKRLHLIVDAIAWLLEANPALQVHWTHVGDGPLLDEVRAYAATRLDERARTDFKGYQTQAQLAALYRDEAFDFIVNVSDSEGIPVSLMEAAAAGMPMVATDVGGSGELANAHTGVLLPADADAATIASAFARFCDRGAAQAWRRAARAHWDAHFNAARNYGRFARQLAGDGGLDERDVQAHREAPAVPARPPTAVHAGIAAQANRPQG